MLYNTIIIQKPSMFTFKRPSFATYYFNSYHIHYPKLYPFITLLVPIYIYDAFISEKTHACVFSDFIFFLEKIEIFFYQVFSSLLYKLNLFGFLNKFKVFTNKFK